jgi:anti-sigma factor RsiW
VSARTLSCRELIEFLADYLDDALPAAERAAFEAHLAVCPYCVDYLASYRETIHLGRQALAEKAEALEEIPVELLDAILDARKRRGGPGSRRP